MVVASRIDWLRSEALAGKTVRFIAGPARDSNKVKVTIRVLPERSPCCPLLLVLLDALEQACHNACVVDRGHRHSSGVCETSFWITQVCAPKNDTRLQQVDGPIGGDDPIAGVYPVAGEGHTGTWEPLDAHANASIAVNNVPTNVSIGELVTERSNTKRGKGVGEIGMGSLGVSGNVHAQASVERTVAFLPSHKCRPTTVFTVFLPSEGPHVQYHSHKHEDSLIPLLQPWGKVFIGKDLGDGWIKVQLPKSVELLQSTRQ